MLREVTTHLIPELPDVQKLRVFVFDDRVKHGTPHHYVLGQRVDTELGESIQRVVELHFQLGDPRQGWNGATSLSLLAAVHDFLSCCQRSQFACEENQVALERLEGAMRVLKGRIIRRHAEGTMHTQQVGAGEQAATKQEAAPARTLGQVAYEGYFDKCGGKSLVSGAALPTFAQQKPEISEAWEAAAVAVLGTVIAELEKGRRFKAYVHKRLDNGGVPVDPAPEATKVTGCRIGARLDWLLERAQPK